MLESSVCLMRKSKQRHSYKVGRNWKPTNFISEPDSAVSAFKASSAIL